MGYTFYFPTKLVISDNAAEDIVLQLGSDTSVEVLILTDPGILRAGIATPIIDQVKAAGFKTLVFSEVSENPDVFNLRQMIESIGKSKPAHVVSIGGGSVLDVGKAAGVLLSNPGKDWEDIQWKKTTIDNPSLPVHAIPTTAGTGSEATHVAVIGDSKGFKMGVVNAYLFSHSAIIDGSLMLSLPAKLTAATGMDALVHAIEAYLGKRANPITDLYALSAIKAIVRWLPEAYHHGDNLEARKAMAAAAVMAGIAFDQSGLGLVHALAGPVCANYHVHHGTGVAVLLPATLAFDAPAIPEPRWADLRAAIGLSESAKPADMEGWSLNLLKELGMPTTLAELGVTSDAIPSIAADATRMAMIGINIRQAGEVECKEVLEAAI